MNNINDELLNKYLDDELNREEKDLVKTAIENSSEVKRRFEALLKAHNLLNSIEEESPSIDFTKLVMNKLNKRSVIARQQKYFLFSILSLLGLIIAGITGYALYQVISSIQPVQSSEIVTNYSKDIGDYVSNLFGQKNLTIFGSVLSFIMLISGYFLYDYQKHSKKNFSH
jgi:cytochrome b subunit of formate dehydrogenase